MRNKVTQRQTLFQAPPFPGRPNPVKLRPHIEDHRDVNWDADRRTMEPYPVSLGSRRSDPDAVSIGPDRCDLVTELSLQRLTFSPAPSRTRAAHRDRPAHGQSSVLCRKGNTIFLQVAKNIKKPCLNATAPALRESCMNYDPFRHIRYSIPFFAPSFNQFCQAQPQHMLGMLHLDLPDLARMLMPSDIGYYDSNPPSTPSKPRRLAQARPYSFFGSSSSSITRLSKPHAAAVDVAMIEAERDLRFGFSNEFLLFLIHKGGFFPAPRPSSNV